MSKKTALPADNSTATNKAPVLAQAVPEQAVPAMHGQARPAGKLQGKSLRPEDAELQDDLSASSGDDAESAGESMDQVQLAQTPQAAEAAEAAQTGSQRPQEPDDVPGAATGAVGAVPALAVMSPVGLLALAGLGLLGAAGGGGGDDGASGSAPVITSNGGAATASVSVAENTTAVTTVVATDTDLGDTRTYSISGGADAAKFTIDATTGALAFVAAPDFEAPTDAGGNNVYDVTVTVTDEAGLTDIQTIAVTVTNASDAPTITSDGGAATASVSVAENTTAVTTVVAADMDAGASVSYSIVGGADAAMFTINATTGALAFITAPDFEIPTDAGANNVYDLTVQASDGTNTDTQAIAVTVTDVNDNSPVITSNGAAATAAVSVVENTTDVTTVTATDLDDTATLSYSITGGADAAKFTINASTGALAFITAPDFEIPTDAGANNVYDVTVQVSDGINTDSQAIAVTVTDINENPVITSNGGDTSATVNVAENTTAVTTVTATDQDAGTTLSYSIVAGADMALFTIDAATGVLAFAAAPDFEAPGDVGADNVYNVTVRVSDGVRTDTQAIAVTVTNVNENPVITSNGAGATAAVNVAENTTAVTTVTATDVDAGSTLTYSIVAGADMALFTIDAATGALAFAAAPDFEAPGDVGADNVYNVTVRVSDGVHTDTQAIAVTVTDVDDFAAAPSAPDLVLASDSGMSGTDNITNDGTSTFTGTGAEVGATVTLFDTDGSTVLGTDVADGAGAWSITSSALADGIHSVSARQTDLAGNVSAPSASLDVTIDTIRPIPGATTFVSGTRAITMDFDEAVTAGTTDMSLSRNPSSANNFVGTALPVDSIGGSGTSTLTLNTAAGSPALAGTDYVRIRFDDSANTVMDLAGNEVSSREVYVGGGGDNTIDLSDYGTGFLQVLRGNGGNDSLVGTRAGNDVLIDGNGLDTLIGGGGADIIRLVETKATGTQFSDTVMIGFGESTDGAMDVITGSTTTADTGFDITSSTAANHDVLNLQSNAIAGNVTSADGIDSGSLARHSITSGILSFEDAAGTAVMINQGNLADAVAYLGQNITGAGATVGFKVDSGNNGSVDALYLFQNNGTIPLSGDFEVPDTLVALNSLTGLASATLGTVAGANVVQLRDTTGPSPTGFGLTSNGLALNFAENAFASTSIALTLLKNGTTTMNVTGVSGSGTTSMAITTDQTLVAADWVLVNYDGTTVLDGLSDAAGNVAVDDDAPTYGGSAEGSSGSNTIDLGNVVNFAATGGYDLNGAGADDTLIGSNAGDVINGGTGADLMTGGAGIDQFNFEQGDSPVGVVDLGVNGILDNGDTFTFAGGVDRIVDFASGESLNLNAPHGEFSNMAGPGWMGAALETPSSSVQPTDGLATDQDFFLTQGSFSGTTFTANSAGADTLVIYDGDSSAGVTQTGIVLSGVTLAQLNAFTGSNFVSHV